MLRVLGTVTPDGRAYEVDTNLRPEGKDGPLVRSLDAYLAYWRRWAKPWEFQALLKARVVAGDAALGEAVLAAAEPFVWPDRLEASAVAEIQALKGVVEGSASVRRAGARQLKLAPGGLRDIEFAVRLQLVHGRHDPSVRHAGTFEGLAALADGGYVGRDDAAAFRDAYAFLRTVEHRLQLVRLRRTHVLPSDEAGAAALARGLGFWPEAAGRDELERFEAELARVQGLVRSIHAKLFYRPLLWRFARLSAAERLPFGPAGGVGAPGRPAERRPRAAQRAAPGWPRTPPASGSRGARVRRPRRGACGRWPRWQAVRRDARGCCARCCRRCCRRWPTPPTRTAAWRGCARSSSGRANARGCCGYCATPRPWLTFSRGCSAAAASSAAGWSASRSSLGALADTAGLERATSAADYRRLADGLRREEEPETVADALRRMRRREMARIAYATSTGLTDVAGTGAELSGLAEACLQAAVDALAGEGFAWR